jgi:hypothetical protein
VRRHRVWHSSISPESVPLTVSLSGRVQEPPALRSASILQAHQAPAYLMRHGPLQAMVRSHLPIATVRVRCCGGKRRQHSPKLSAPRPQPKRAWGPNPTSTSRQRARRAPRLRSQRHVAARARQLNQTETPAGRSSQTASTQPPEPSEEGCFTSSRRLDDLSDLLTNRTLSGMRQHVG